VPGRRRRKKRFPEPESKLLPQRWKRDEEIEKFERNMKQHIEAIFMLELKRAGTWAQILKLLMGRGPQWSFTGDSAHSYA